MGYCGGETRKIAGYIKDVRMGDTDESCFFLVRYLVNGECIRRGIMLNEGAFWDISVDVYMQIKERLERHKRNADGQYLIEREIENPVAYIYFAVPKRFCASIRRKKNEDDRTKATMDYETLRENPSKFDVVDFLDEEMASQNIKHIISEYLGGATTNKELKERKQKIRGAGYSVTNTEHGYEIEPLPLSQKEIKKIKSQMNMEKCATARQEALRVAMIERLNEEENKIWQQQKKKNKKSTTK